MRKQPGQTDYGSNFMICVGVVKNNADPMQHGRLQVYVPSLDPKDFKTEELPWCQYVSPFGGTTVDYLAGREQSKIPGASTYGFWAIPKVGAQVIIGFLEGDPTMRCWLGCIFMPEMNRTLPSSIDPIKSEIDDSGMIPQQTIPHLKMNLNKAGLQPGSQHYKTRGGYERSVSHPSNKNRNKPTDNGYYPKPSQPNKSDSQTICLTSPGRHYFLMSDVDEYCRVRLKTTEGSQIIFDDTNERIYISTARGKNWVELDEGNGKIYIYSDSKVNIRSKNDINLYSDENVNIVAKHRVNIRSEDRAVVIHAKHDVRLNSTDADIMLTASRDIQLKTTDGPKANPESEMTSCEPDGKHLIYRWAEKGGSSTSQIKLDAADDINIRSKKLINITSKESLHVKSLEGNIFTTASDGYIHVRAQKNINLQSLTQSIALTSKNHIDFYAQKELIARSNRYIRIECGYAGDGSGAGNIDIVSGSVVINQLMEGPTGSYSPRNNNTEQAETADTAEKVSLEPIIDHMVRPDHESWNRDEDEGRCKTPRNKKYQG